MKHLENYIRIMTEFRAKPVTMPLTQANVNEISEAIDADIAPENLSQDGERSDADMREELNTLIKTLKELQTYAKANGLVTPKTWEI